MLLLCVLSRSDRSEVQKKTLTERKNMNSDKTTGKAELPQPQPLTIPGQFEPLLDDVQAANMLGLHPKTLQKLARQGAVPAIRIGRYWRFRASALNQWINVHSTCQPLTERTQ